MSEVRGLIYFHIPMSILLLSLTFDRTENANMKLLVCNQEKKKSKICLTGYGVILKSFQGHLSLHHILTINQTLDCIPIQ